METPIRKPIQICAAAYQGFGVVALCDDGTIWMNDRPYDVNGTTPNCNWYQVRSIPGTEATPPASEEG